jgi:hypothetical protein
MYTGSIYLILHGVSVQFNTVHHHFINKIGLSPNT